ncbi:uncharacterized protein TNCV_3015601 [Trichonephila clavipes]|nr:uncharacterized protein TNCV_3015601 [Trichonephila clavipes]
MLAADILCRITEFYGTEAMRDKKVRKWIMKFKDGRTNVHDEHSGQPSVIIHDLKQAVERKNCENRRFTIATLSLEVPDVSRPDLALSTFHLFQFLKHSLGGKCFSDNEEVKVAVNSCLFDQTAEEGFQNLVLRTATAGSDVVQSGRPIFDDFFQHLWPYIGNNTANIVFQMVKRSWLIRIDQ